jgi:ABC-type phosphate transport system permease subunit
MFLTVFLAVVFCAAITILLISAVAFVQDQRFFSSAPKEAREVIKPRDKELFYGARAMGWVMIAISIMMILGAGAVSVWDGLRSGFFIHGILSSLRVDFYDLQAL